MSNKFSKQEFMYYFYCRKQFCEQFYVVLILYSYVGCYHITLAISLKLNCYIWKKKVEWCTQSTLKECKAHKRNLCRVLAVIVKITIPHGYPLGTFRFNFVIIYFNSHYCVCVCVCVCVCACILVFMK